MSIYQTDQYDHEWFATLETKYADQYLIDAKMRAFMRRLCQAGRIEFLTTTDQNMDHIYRDITYSIWDETRYTDQRINLSWIDVRQYIEHDRPNKNERKAVSFSKWLKQNHNYKLSADLKSKIGNYFKLPDKRQIKVVFSMGCAGTASEYYHEDSCYWGSFASSRDLIEHNLGGAIRIYDVESGEIISRSWFLPYSGDDLTNGFIMFNTYGSGDLDHSRTVADLVVATLGANLQETSLYLDYDGDDLIYLNSRTTFFIGAVWDKYNKPRANVALDVPDEFKYGNRGEYCEQCETYGHNEDDMYYVEHLGYSICDYCLRRDFTWVERSDDYLPNDEVIEIRYNGYWTYFDINDDDLIVIDGEHYHMDDCIEDVHGNYYAPGDTDSWVELDSGEIYPADECVYNEELEQYEIR